MSERRYARRWILRISGLILFCILAHFVHREWQFWSNGNYLKGVLAKTDQVDPGWRWEEMESKLREIPDDENAALVVKKVHSHLGKRWNDLSMMLHDSHWDELLEEELLEPGMKELLDLMLEEHREAVTAARTLIHYRKAYYPFEMKPNPFTILLEPVQHTREVASVLRYDALRLANENQPDLALQNSRAILHLARTLENCPMLIPMLVRVALDSIAVGTTERTLALTEPKSGLKELAQELLEEADQPILVQALRSERAMNQRFLENFESGQLELKELFEWAGAVGIKTEPSNRFQRYLYQPKLAYDHAKVLESMNQMIETAKKAPHIALTEFNSVPTPSNNRGLDMVRVLLPLNSSCFDTSLRANAILRCAAVALLVEVHRQRHGNWPESLEQVDKDLLPKVPLDPYDGKPLRMIAEETGVVIYSIGADLVDNQGSIDPSPTTIRTLDLGFRLFDPSERRVKAMVVPEQLPLPQELQKDEG